MDMEEFMRGCGGRKPRRKPRAEEHKLQKSMVDWFRLRHPSMRHNLFAVPNGGRRDATSGWRLKEEGVLPGVADLILLKSNRFYGALLLEVKTAAGRQSREQKEWEERITADGFKYAVVRSLDGFITVMEDYLKEV